MAADISSIHEHMEVVGSDGQHVGTVDHIDGSRIKLTKSDRASGGRHHMIPTDWVQSADGTVRLNKPAQEAISEWEAGE